MAPDALEEILGILPRPVTPRQALRNLGHDGHRITTKAWKNLLQHYKNPEDALEFRILGRLESLAPIAYVAYRHGHVLCTSYDFTTRDSQKTLWFVPSEYGSITIMLPEEKS